MAWKIERWLDEVFPGEKHLYSAYRGLPPRELVIVASAILDCALAALLEKRFRDFPDEAASFLGADGDGRAPAATFGARIQLALLLGILTKDDVAPLRRMRNLRNLFAHRVKVDFSSKLVMKELIGLQDEMTFFGLYPRMGNFEKLHSPLLRKEPGAGEALILSFLTLYQIHFRDLMGKTRRVGFVEVEHLNSTR